MRFAYSQVENLNEAEMCVYNYIVKNLKHILNLSVRELADEVHVSTATVMRFCKKMGYSGFSELAPLLQMGGDYSLIYYV